MKADANSHNRILIVDDEPDILELVADSLRSHGYFVQTATSGNQALKKSNSEEFDLIISDIMMPDGDGIYLADEIRKKHKKTPYIFFITGYSNYSNEEAFSKGVNEVFQKPFSFSDFIQKVDQYLC